MVLAQLEASMQKNANQSILIPLYKAQVQVDQGLPHKTSYTETNKRKSGGKALSTWAQGKFS